jgi:hypothetical protein
VLQVSEYILFDPHEEYLKPSLQGFRLREGVYVPIQPTAEGRLYSEQLGLERGRVGQFVRLYDPATGQMLLTSYDHRELEANSRPQAEAQRQQAEARRQQAEARRQQAEAQRLELADALRKSQGARRASEQQVEELRRELEELRQRMNKPS